MLQCVVFHRSTYLLFNKSYLKGLKAANEDAEKIYFVCWKTDVDGVINSPYWDQGP